MVDRLVHYAEVIVLKGDSYPLKDKQVITTDSNYHRAVFNRPRPHSFQQALITDVANAST